MARRDPPDVRQLYSVRVDDAELVRLAASGDRDAWSTIYDCYADRLHDYCWSILRDRHEAEDALHDAFVTAATKLHQLRVAALIVAGAAFFALRPTTAPVSATGSGPSLTPAAAPSASATPGTIVTVPSQGLTATATAATPVAAPGVIELLNDAIDFGDTSTEASLQFRNTGGSELSWTLSLQDAAIAASAVSGWLVRSCQRRPDSRSGRAH